MSLALLEKARKSRYDRISYQVLVHHLVGGVPNDPKVAAGWLKKNLGADNEALIQEMVAQTMAERGVEMDAALEEVTQTIKLNGFKRDPERGLYIEGRQIKAAIKEAASVAWGKRQDWGPTRKGTHAFWAEHVFVEEDRVYLGTDKPSGVQQSFTHTWRGNSISYEEYVEDVKLSFTILTDASKAISPKDWAEMWATAENLGLGAKRSQGFGKFIVVAWDGP